MVNPLSGKTASEYTLWKTEEEIQKYRDGSDPWRYPNTSWYTETFKNWTPQQIHNATLEGGTENTQYCATFGYRGQESMFRNSATNYDQFNLRINLDVKINDYIKAGVSLMGREERREYPSQAAGDVLWFTARGRPTDHAYWPNGLPGPAQEYGRNPVVATSDETGYDRDKRYYAQSNANLEITQPWIEGLKLTLNLSYDKFNKRRKKWEQPWYLYTWDGNSLEADGTPKLDKSLSYVSSPDSKLNEYAEDKTDTSMNALLTYDRTFNGHGISILFGAEKQKNTMNYIEASRRYYLSNAVQLLSAGGDLEKSNTSGGQGDASKLNYDRRRASAFGRVAYNYQEKYLAEFLWRYDGSWMFPRENRWGFFPGVLLGYRISEENFWKENVGFIDYFKIRASYMGVYRRQ